jgi:hypothetical protein
MTCAGNAGRDENGTSVAAATASNDMAFLPLSLRAELTLVEERPSAICCRFG